MTLERTYYGNPILRRRADPIEEIDEEVLQLIAEMKQLVIDLQALGLAAPQVGHSLRLFIVRFPVAKEYEKGEEFDWEEPRAFINPTLTDPDPRALSCTEGCVSIPDVYVEVVRPGAITVEAMDETGKKFKERIEGYPARIVMHENDHINGVLMIDRISPGARREVEPILRKIKKQYKGEG